MATKLYTIAQVADGSTELTEVGEHWRYRLRALPLLVLLGMGLALSNTRAVLKAVLGLRQGFQRAPKFALRRPEDTWVGSVYALSRDSLMWGELGLAVFALALLAAPGVHWGFAPWLLLYAGGLWRLYRNSDATVPPVPQQWRFGYVAAITLRQAHQRRRCLCRNSGGCAKQTRPAANKVERIPQGGPDRIHAGWPDRDR
jgi:hypothetical protein